MKYIIFDNQYPVLFPDEIIHCEVSVFDMKPTSAGHYSPDKGIYGESESLGLVPSKNDLQLINSLIKK